VSRLQRVLAALADADVWAFLAVGCTLLGLALVVVAGRH
jgi:hypothetical protein